MNVYEKGFVRRLSIITRTMLVILSVGKSCCNSATSALYIEVSSSVPI